MDTMIFCHKCKVEEMIDFGDAEDWRCPKCNQPERSKREDPIDRFIEEIKLGWIRENLSGMRCSEHDGNIVREVQ